MRGAAEGCGPKHERGGGVIDDRGLEGSKRGRARPEKNGEDRGGDAGVVAESAGVPGGEHRNGRDAGGELEGAGDGVAAGRVDRPAANQTTPQTAKAMLATASPGSLAARRVRTSSKTAQQQTRRVADQVAGDVGVQGRMQTIRQDIRRVQGRRRPPARARKIGVGADSAPLRCLRLVTVLSSFTGLLSSVILIGAPAETVYRENPV